MNRFSAAAKPKEINQISPRIDRIFSITLFIVCAFCIFPFLLMLSVSFTDEVSIRLNGYSLIPKVFSTYAYQYLLTTSKALLRAYGISIFVTVAGTLLSVMIVTMFAYPLARKDFPFRKQFSFFIFFTMIFSGGLVPWYMVYARLLGLKNTIWIYLIPLLVSAWNVIVMRTFITTSIPESLFEAAKIDGASEMTIFFQVVLPLSLPGLATIGLFTAIHFWNDWYTPLVFITKSDMYNLQYSMYSALRSAQYIAENVDKMASSGVTITKVPVETIRMAMCVVSVGPIIIAYPFVQKYFIKGLTVGAVKG